MMKNIVIYHANCADGFTAAWVARRALFKEIKETAFYPGIYGDPPPMVKGLNVFIVDFSYDQKTMDKICEDADSVVMLDHHKSARQVFDQCAASYPDFFSGVFDDKRSGALLCWDYFFPEKAIPKFVQIISDRDLWQFKLPYTRTVMATIFSRAYDFDTWDWLCDACEGDGSRLQLEREGEAIERKHHKDVEELVIALSWSGELGANGVETRFCNIPYVYSSDAGHLMCKKYEVDYAVCYWEDDRGNVVFSLRSLDDGADVSDLARIYHGGGHAHAAGFRTSKQTASIIMKRYVTEVELAS